MKRYKTILIIAFSFYIACSMRIDCRGNETEDLKTPFLNAASDTQRKLDKSLKELSALREKIANEKIPLNHKLNDLENELIKVRRDYQKQSRLLDSRTLDLSNLRTEIKSRREESTYLSNLLSEYIRNFESRLHIAELQRYEEILEKSKFAVDNSNLSAQEVYKAQTMLVDASLDRLFEAIGGVRFEGSAIDDAGIVKKGAFVLAGPAALFSSDDGQTVGSAEQRLGSLEPVVISFQNPSDKEAAEHVVNNSKGYFPFDPTLGNAIKIESTEESFIEHARKGGPVMIPIFLLAGAAFATAIYKWYFLSRQRNPSRKKLNALLTAIEKHDKNGALKSAGQIEGPAGEMLVEGAKHLKEPSELIEEVMYEIILSTKLKLQSLLPFIAISASSAPLLGLLGTVTGIINTFKLITIFGSGDVKTLSGGISEALITTKFGLIVAIPSLLMYAFLSRKSRGIIAQMEKAAVSFVNQVNRTPYKRVIALKNDKDETLSESIDGFSNKEIEVNFNSAKISPSNI